MKDGTNELRAAIYNRLNGNITPAVTSMPQPDASYDQCVLGEIRTIGNVGAKNYPILRYGVTIQLFSFKETPATIEGYVGEITALIPDDNAYTTNALTYTSFYNVGQQYMGTSEIPGEYLGQKIMQQTILNYEFKLQEIAS